MKPTVDRYVYVVPGDPIALMRAKLGRGRMYDAQKARKLVTGLTIRNQHKDKPFLTGPLFMLLGFYLPIPLHVKNKDNYEGKYHFSPPDLSNVIKYIEDVCQGIVFQNDCIISATFSDKVYSQWPRTEVEYIQLPLKKVTQL